MTERLTSQPHRDQILGPHGPITRLKINSAQTLVAEFALIQGFPPDSIPKSSFEYLVKEIHQHQPGLPDPTYTSADLFLNDAIAWHIHQNLQHDSRLTSPIITLENTNNNTQDSWLATHVVQAIASTNFPEISERTSLSQDQWRLIQLAMNAWLESDTPPIHSVSSTSFIAQATNTVFLLTSEKIIDERKRLTNARAQATRTTKGFFRKLAPDLPQDHTATLTLPNNEILYITPTGLRCLASLGQPSDLNPLSSKPFTYEVLTRTAQELLNQQPSTN